MKAQNVCCCCGRTIENSFVYCPWCGKEVITPAKAQLFDEPVFQRIECISDDIREQRLFKIEYSLNQLEEDLSRMLADCQK